MSIWTGKDGYDALAEFLDRTERELGDRDGDLYRRDTEPPEDEIAWVRDMLAGCRSVLELGCGFGTWASVAEPDCAYLGVDPIAERIEEAKRRNPLGAFLVGDACSFRCSLTFDAVLFVTVLQHLTMSDAVLVLKTAAAHLRPDGVAVLLESGILRVSEAEAEARYAAASCSAHMIPKPLGLLEDEVPEFRWAQGERADRWVLTRR